MAEKMHTLSLRLSEEDYERVRVAAFLGGQSINGLIREAVRHYTETEGRRQSVAAAIDIVRKQHRGALDKLA